MNKLKLGGRTKGTPNKITKDVRQTISDFINHNIDNLQNDFNKLEPKDKLLFLEKLLKYVIPTKVDFNNNFGLGVDDIIIKRKDDDELIIKGKKFASLETE